MRQLRDVKLSALVETYDAKMLSIYAAGCWHARMPRRAIRG